MAQWHIDQGQSLPLNKAKRSWLIEESHTKCEGGMAIEYTWRKRNQISLKGDWLVACNNVLILEEREEEIWTDLWI